MSKIAEQKALEAYPDKYTHTPFGINTADINDFKREAYAECYDKAMQDFLDKACKYLTPINYTHPHLIDLDDFKSHMQNEM